MMNGWNVNLFKKTENHISPSTECEVTAPTMTDLTAVDPEDQDPFHNSDNDELDPDYNTLNSGSKSDSESSDEPATGIEIENAKRKLQERGKEANLIKEL
ncbi:hypothetical protein Avbf_15127 [Armadillidium vulgare]|nr:hypothetical protein Avbf_15127 [Armadillidium vulgare]